MKASQWLSGPELNSLKTKCKHGHPLSGDNLYIRAQTWYAARLGKVVRTMRRDCLTCRRETARLWAKTRRETGKQ